RISEHCGNLHEPPQPFSTAADIPDVSKNRERRGGSGDPVMLGTCHLMGDVPRSGEGMFWVKESPSSAASRPGRCGRAQRV
ncbi:MAG TPA: hypothetical protein VM686_42250, partial [Polyangiaceae bacterium]|nr:hypothetical protein [Polyangiaceae bacterium]